MTDHNKKIYGLGLSYFKDSMKICDYRILCGNLYVSFSSKFSVEVESTDIIYQQKHSL